jgi:hypothetical protein
MKLIPISMIAIVLFSCGKKSDPAPLVLLTNLDMEQGTSQPTAWFNFAGNGGATTWTTEQSVSPKHSLKISNDVAYSQNIALWSQTYQGAMPVGKDLVLAVKIKGNLIGSGVSIALRADETTTIQSAAKQFSSTEGVTPIGGNFDWTAYQVKLVGLQSSIKSITVYFIYLPNTTGTVYFDDATLTY